VGRINIEDSLFKDKRFIDLCMKLGGFEAGLGAIVHCFIVGQEYWLSSGGRGIPRPAWIDRGIRSEVIAAGLASDDGEFVLVEGSKKQFAWLTAASENGKKGGPAASKARLENIKKSKRQNTSGGTQNTSDTSSYSFSSSFSNTNTENKIPSGESQLALVPPADLPVPKKSKYSEETRTKMRAFIAAYSSAYREKYGGPPESLRQKPIIGKIGDWIEHVSEERAIQLVQIYLQISYRPIDESCHDLWQFFRQLNRIGNALATGQNPESIDWRKVFGAA